jgi:hypothetical protein
LGRAINAIASIMPATKLRMRAAYGDVERIADVQFLRKNI